MPHKRTETCIGHNAIGLLENKRLVAPQLLVWPPLHALLHLAQSRGKGTPLTPLDPAGTFLILSPFEPHYCDANG